MKIIEKIDHALFSARARFTCELLPPLKGDGPDKIFAALDPLMELDPAYINVTFHREDAEYIKRDDGSDYRRIMRRRPGTVGISAAIMKRYGIEVVPHIICGGMSRYDIEDALIDLDFLGMHNVLALRGDNLRGEDCFVPHPEGHSHANELVEQIVRMNNGQFIDDKYPAQHHRTDFCIGVAGYPEKHYESDDCSDDIQRLKAKVDAGASYVVTQMSFDNSKILSFIGRCREAGITVPIIPGIKPLSTRSQLDVLPKIFRVDLPEDLLREAAKCKDNAAIYQLGIEWAIAQSRDLLKAGVPVLHYYTMGKTDNLIAIAGEVF